jgi:hypothetical protein
VRRATLSLVLLTIFVAGAGSASAGGFDVRVGGFFPRGDLNTSLFSDLNDLYTPNASGSRGVKGSDFNAVFGGVEYNTRLAEYVEVGFSIDGLSRKVDTSYRDYLHSDRSEIQQTLKLEMMPIGATIRLIPTGKRTRVAPYLGGGIDAVYYKYEEYGDLIDFGDPTHPIGPGALHSQGVAFGVHAVAGVRVYLNRDFAIVGEGRYQWAQKDMADDFVPNESGLINRIDLTGPSVTIGVHVRF